jgi:enterochelin esterase-like enzyme
MEPAAGAWCTGSAVGFRLHDHERRLAGVRMSSGVLPAADFTYQPAARVWELRLPRPPVWRIEYRYELRYPGGGAETVPDPDNPLRAGDASELRCTGYREPAWLDRPLAAGSWRDVWVPLPAVRGEMVARIWSPAEPTTRVLVAHDGPEYDRMAGLHRYAAAMIGAGRLPPFHLALLPPGERLEWYSASPAYARALTGDVLPRIGAELGTDEPVAGIGASLGALALLHAQRRHPERFAGLFLQSGSFFQPRYDRQESGFRRYLRIVRFTGRVLRDDSGPAVPVTLTCGAAEENRANNADMAATLRRQGYPAEFAEVPDVHAWTGWRDAFDPYLTELLHRVWS